jgi:hypothetical protein
MDVGPQLDLGGRDHIGRLGQRDENEPRQDLVPVVPVDVAVPMALVAKLHDCAEEFSLNRQGLAAWGGTYVCQTCSPIL